MNAKVKISTFVIFIMSLLLISTPYISQRANNIIKLIVELFLLIVLLSQKNIKKNTLKSSIPILLLLLFSLISTYKWSGLSTRLLNNFVTIGSYFTFFVIIHMSAYKLDRKSIICLLKKIMIFYSIIIDFFVIITLGKGLGGLDEPVYLLGNKFITSYIHMFILSLMSYESKDYKKIIIYYLYSLFILLLADTTTGVIGLSIILLLQITKNEKLIDFLSKPKTAIFLFLSINAIFLLSNKLFEIDFINNFFLKNSHTDSLLSGRLVMYKIVMKSISLSPIWGYGFNYDIVSYTLGFGNPQNGILKYLLDFGIVGTCMLIFVIYTSFKKIFNCSDINLKRVFVSFIYSMLICSLVEINLSAIFMLALALSNLVSIDTKKKE